MSELTLQSLFQPKDLGKKLLKAIAECSDDVKSRSDNREYRTIDLRFNIFQNEKGITVLRGKFKRKLPGDKDEDEILLAINLETDRSGQISFEFAQDPLPDETPGANEKEVNSPPARAPKKAKEK